MAHKKRQGIVYSTNPDFKYKEDPGNDIETLPPSRQTLHIWLESKNRSGKVVTLVKGFKGNIRDLEDLGTSLKKFCGTGGSVKDGEIIIQGDFRDKIITWLAGKGYKTKKSGGS